jgi:uncharacterized protein YjbI with pentapeptide repeats
MNKQDGTQATSLQRPRNDHKEAWEAQDQTWRTEPEIDVERQKFLVERRSITPNIEQGMYPFKDIKLSRADVEWLLATHESGGARGPIDWSDESQRQRKGLDLRGAILNEENLSGLPLACVIGGLDSYIQVTPTSKSILTTTDQRDKAAVHMEGANLEEAHLERANLARSHLNNANIRRAYLERALLIFAHLEKAYLSRAHLEGAVLRRSHLEGTILYNAYLAGAELRGAIFNNETNLEGIHLGDGEYGYASLTDISWAGANLAVVDWASVKTLGDEHEAHQPKYSNGKMKDQVKDKARRVLEYRWAVRANRQLSVVLRDQGLNEEADYFAYRAQRLRRIVWRREGLLPQQKFRQRIRGLGSYLLSIFLDLLSGYGYKPSRSIIAYLLVICGFATVYYVFGHLPLFPDSLIFSLTSFHGRGFFPSLSGETNLHNPLVIFAALEAIVGLFIEISFIATFTQRFFGR